MSRKIVPLFRVNITNSKLCFNEETTSEMNEYLKSLKDDLYLIKIFKPAKERTDKQHRLYWLYLNVLEKEGMGDAEQLHEYFKRVHLQPIIIEVMGREMTIPNSTKNLSTKEFSEYLLKIYMETGVPVPSLDNWDFN